MPFPSIYNLSQVFESSDLCITYLFKHEILYKEIKCSLYKKNMIKNNKIWRYTKRDCKKKVLIFFKSFFSDSKIEPHKVLYILYLKLANVLSTSIQLISGHSSATISALLEKYRDLLASNINESNELIGGPGIEVEIDKTLISRKKTPR